MSSHPNLTSLFRNGELLHIEKGHVFLRAGDAIEYIHLITEGVAYSYRFGPKGEKITHSFYSPGDVMPVSGIRMATTMSTSFEALTPLKMYRLPRPTFMKLIQSDGQASYELAIRITEQYNHYVQRVGNLQYTNSYDRVVYCFILLAQRFGRATPSGGIEITLPLTHSLIGSTINVARETASRCMKRLTQKGIIKKQSKLYNITDLTKLGAELHDKSVFTPDLFRW